MGMANVEVYFKGCENCLVEGMAAHMATGKPLKEFINKTVRRANELRAQKNN